MVDSSTIANLTTNVTNIVVEYSAKEITDAIQMKALMGFSKLFFASLSGVGIKKVDIKSLKAFFVIIFSILSIWGIIDLFQAIASSITKTMP